MATSRLCNSESGLSHLFRSDLNSVLQAVVSNNSGASEPSTKYAYQMWYETDTNIWKMRNADNDDWDSISYI